MKRIFFYLLILSFVLYADELEVEFRSNSKVSSSELYSIFGLYESIFDIKNPKIKTKQIDFYRTLLKEFYTKQGYYHTQIDTILKDNIVVFDITEGEAVIVENIIINKNIEQILDITNNEIFKADKFTKSKEAIKMFFQNDGFCNIKLDAKAFLDLEKNRAYLYYYIDEGSLCLIDNIKIDSDIDKKTISSLLFLKQGDIFNATNIRLSYESLYSYSGISKAIIKDIKTEDNLVDVDVLIQKNQKPIRFKSGIAVTSDKGVVGMLSVKHSDLFNNLESLLFELKASMLDQKLRVLYDEVLEDRHFASLEFGYKNEEFKEFKEDAIFVEPSYSKRVYPHLFKTSVIMDRSRLYATKYSNSIYLRDSINFVASPKLEYIYDSRDDTLDPTRGFYLDSYIMASHKSLLSDASYYKYFIEASGVVTFYNTTLGIRNRFGTIDIKNGQLPLSYRFFTGGMYSNRAYRYQKLNQKEDNPIGNDSIFETTLEARVEVYKDFKMVLFSDNTYLDPNISLNDNYNSVGFGGRYKSLLGLIGLDFGFDVKQPRKNYAISFHIGELF